MTRIVLMLLAMSPMLCTRVFSMPVPRKSPSQSAGVIYLGEEMERLKKMAADLDIPDEQLVLQNGDVFGKIPDKGTVNIGTFQPRGWEQPEYVVRPDNDRRTGEVDGMMHSFRETLAAKEVPLPVPVLETMAKDYAMVENLRQAGKVDYDKQGFLWKGTLGGYVYNAREVIGIFLHEDLRIVARYLGDVFASLTLISHEGAHGTRDAEKGLSPKHSIQDEVDSFNHQADALKVMDKEGKILSRFWALYVEGQAKNVSEETRKLLASIVKHLHQMRVARERDSMREFVENLGYRNQGNAGFPQQAGSLGQGKI